VKATGPLGGLLAAGAPGGWELRDGLSVKPGNCVTADNKILTCGGIGADAPARLPSGSQRTTG
jgi:hypothetical protein